MDWSGVDCCDVFISSHSDGTHSLQSIHCWASDGMLNFSKSDKETNSPTFWMAWGGAHFNLWENHSFKEISSEVFFSCETWPELDMNVCLFRSIPLPTTTWTDAPAYQEPFQENLMSLPLALMVCLSRYPTVRHRDETSAEKVTGTF